MNQYICRDSGDFLYQITRFNEVQSYDINNNSVLFFRVSISDRGLVRIGLLDGWGHVEIELLEANPEKIWLGDCPHNPSTNPFDKGSSILLHISGKRYLFCGEFFYIFESLHPIVEFVSSRGGDGLTYPFAVDSEDYYYFFTTETIIKNTSGTPLDFPYEYYYYSCLITPPPNFGTMPTMYTIIPKFQGITEWWIGGEKLTMRYTPNPSKEYDRLMRLGYGNKKKAKMYVKKINQEKLVEVSKEDYVNIIEAFGQKKGFIPIKTRIIRERINRLECW